MIRLLLAAIFVLGFVLVVTFVVWVVFQLAKEFRVEGDFIE